MSFLPPAQTTLWTAIFSTFVMVIFWIEYRRLRGKLLVREEQMKHRMYELSILREIGERIGYSLDVQKIVEIITGSLGKLLPYSTAAFMIPHPSAEGRILFRITLAGMVSKEFIGEVRKRMLVSFTTLFGKPYGNNDIEESVTGSLTDPTSQESVNSFFNIPIVINSRPAGILTVASTLPGLYRKSEDVEILYTMMSQASEAVSKLQTVLEIEKGKLNSMVRSMADGVLMVDSKEQLMVINPQTTKLLELKTDTPTIFDVLNVLSDRLDLRAKIAESIAKDQVVVENEIQLHDQFVQILISPVKDNKNQPIGSVVLFHDITHEKELEKLREDFTSMMVHELRSPLTGIRSIASLLQNDRIKNEKQKYEQFINLISSNSNSMLDLVNDLLDVAKLESGKFAVFKKPSDLHKIISDRVDSFQTLAKDNGLTIEKNIFPEIPTEIPIDEQKIGQVLNNLLSNAIKFTEEGGKITVAAFVCKKMQDIPEAADARNLSWKGMRHGLLCPTDSIVVSVTDTGVGIAESEITKLFNKFQQLASSARSEKKGTGLGLVILKGIVEAHGGEVGVFSEHGQGTTFYFTLPLQESVIINRPVQKAAVA